MRRAVHFPAAVAAAAVCAAAPAWSAPDRDAVSPLASAPTVYMIRYTPGPAYRPDVPLLRQDLSAHGAYMRALTERGVILAAGPTMSVEGGLVLVAAPSLEAARAHMDADPAVVAGIFSGEISDWRPAFDPGARFAGAGVAQND